MEDLEERKGVGNSLIYTKNVNNALLEAARFEALMIAISARTSGDATL